MKFTELPAIGKAVLLESLTMAQLRELQQALHHLGYPVGPIDGLYGPRTKTAWSEFKFDEYQGNVDEIGPGSIRLLAERVSKRDGVVHDFSTKDGTIKAIAWECADQGLPLRSQIAYVIATVQHETGNTFKPIAEWGKGKGRSYGRPDPVTGKTYYGRGYVQLTWKTNYQKYSNILGVDLVNNPDLAMEPNVSLFILVHGFKTGAFTGRKLTDYVNTRTTDFVNARRCINGMDKAQHIANLARSWLPKVF
jgi:hypothetical protein